jgi:hypothetical protein
MFTNDAKFLSFVASTDLRTRQNHIVNLTSTAFKVDLAAAKAGFGVLANAPNAGENAQVAIDGVQTIRAGAAIAVGDQITAAASGYAAVWVAGAVATVMGRALAAAASGSLVPVLLRVTEVSS